MNLYRISSLSVLSLGLAFSAACGDDDDHHEHPDAAVKPDAGDQRADAAPEFDAATTQAVTINFAAMVGAEPFACSVEGGAAKTFADIGTANSTVYLKDFRFYVSNVRLVDDGDNEVPVTLTNDGVWQLQTESDGHVALLDFEDGTANCADVGNAETNTSVTGTVPVGTYTGLVFDLGVPFALNHLDLATAESPLNISAMFWTWALGHKFARLDYQVDGGAAWNFHLGSTMCVSGGNMEPPTEACGRPNLPTIRLAAFESGGTVNLDAAAIVSDSDLTTNAGMTPGCQSFPHDESDCTALFPNLGIDYTTGVCINDCAEQGVFSVAQ